MHRKYRGYPGLKGLGLVVDAGTVYIPPPPLGATGAGPGLYTGTTGAYVPRSVVQVPITPTIPGSDTSVTVLPTSIVGANGANIRRGILDPQFIGTRGSGPAGALFPGSGQAVDQMAPETGVPGTDESSAFPFGVSKSETETKEITPGQGALLLAAAAFLLFGG